MNIETSKINTTKNLLAFSAGIDSTALFFLLLENNISFDIAIVNYNIREQAKKEIEYAKELAKKFNKKIFIKDINLENKSNFEKKARDIRYSFFEEIINENSYETLITAHQLNDKLEWFLMQLSRGAGLVELLSFEECSRKKNYSIFRPLLNSSRQEIEEYLEKNSIKYFIDETNNDTKYKRNYFRKEFSNKFIKKFKEGVKKSFKYLHKDLTSLNINTDIFIEAKKLTIYKNSFDDNINIRVIDLDLKKRGFLLSKLQRDEILKQKQCVISHKVSISITNEFIYIAPYETTIIMPKKFKEKCRINKIPKNIRAYIFKQNIFEKIEKIF